MIAALLLALAAATGSSSTGSSTTEAPPFHIVHPESLARQAGQVAAAAPAVLESLTRSLGAPPLPPTTLYLISPDSLELGGPDAGAMPDWAAGIALPSEDTVIIRVDRVGAWRQRQLIGVLAHETAHLLMYRAAGPGAASMPGWFREGVAANLARDGEWLDFFYLWVSSIPSSPRPLADLSAGFGSGASPVMVRAAYAGSYSFVRHQMQAHSPALAARVLAGLRQGLEFDAAWSAATGASLAAAESAWAASIRGRSRWAAILTSAGTLWAVVTLMVVVAWLVKKRRGARVMERWEQEDPFE